MVEQIRQLLQEKNILSHFNQGILVASVSDTSEGIDLAKTILAGIIDKHMLLLLSGGRTPKDLYTSLAKEEAIIPGAVGMIDERFGLKFHENSNELMIRNTGFLRYLEMRDIPFYSILEQKKSISETATAYDDQLREFFSKYHKTIGILGIGIDGHTAGIPALDATFRSQHESLYSGTDVVSGYTDETGKYGERITMTFLGLAHLDLFLVLVFGVDKKSALDEVFSEGPEEVIPGRFFKQPSIAKRTLIITDQNI